jgi:acetyltransferase-like isoleucine patch superfamily enzyme
MLLTIAMTLGTLILYALGIVMLGFALFPGALLCAAVWMATGAWPLWPRILSVCFTSVAAYLLYGGALIAMAGALRVLLRLNLKEGEYPLVSSGAIKWGLAVALKAPVSITFMNVMLMTPFAPLFYRMMGAKIGRNVQINSKSCADPSLLEIGSDSVIGGHATVLGHSFERGRLILQKVTIGSGVTVGLNAVLLPGVDVGDGATIAAGAIVPKGTKVAAGSTYFGSQAGAMAPTPCMTPVIEFILGGD